MTQDQQPDRDVPPDLHRDTLAVRAALPRSPMARTPKPCT
jgi:hypothetical protein